MVLQAQLDKIRSDASECMLLSKLVADGKGQVFVRTAEHLNALALELEKTHALNSGGPGTDQEAALKTSIRDPDGRPASETDGIRLRRGEWGRILAGVLLVLVIGGGILGASSKQAREYWPSYVQPKQATQRAIQEQTAENVAASLSQEQAERKILVQHVNELTARMDSLTSSLNSLMAARDETAGQRIKEGGAAEESSSKSVGTLPLEAMKSAPLSNPAHPSASSPAANHANSIQSEPVDTVGAITAAPRQTGAAARKPSAGPQGCTQFRSYDAASETYVTMDGRRRECRQ